MKKIIMFLGGFALTIAGIMLVLKQWDQVVFVFQGVSGVVLAVGGLVALFAATLKSHD